MSNDELFELIAKYYLSSRDFNGLPIRTIDLPIRQLKSKLAELIKNGDMSLVFEEQDVNPYVKRLKPWNAEKQVEKLKDCKDITHVVAYPEGSRLAEFVKPQKYSGKPYRLVVAKGRPCLDCAYFRLDVLEKFRNDPRYYYKLNDIVGAIYNRDEGGIAENDSLYIKSVGFAYDNSFNRAVCVFYTDLMELSKEQQQYWKHFEITGTYEPHPDFIYSQIYGQFPSKASLPEALTGELKAINNITMDAYGKKLLKEDFYDEKRPKELAFLIIPTAKELENFIHLLDKLISENINPKFFRGLVKMETEEIRKDGKIIVRNKGTLQMLEEYIRKWFKPKMTKPMDNMFKTFKTLRLLRTTPAHKIQDDKFDMKYFKEQRKLFIEVYTAVRCLRLILQNHPKADRSKIPEWLYVGDIWTY